MAKDFTKKNEPTFRINDEIRYQGEVRIVGEGVESQVVSLNKAKEIAASMELDLIEINRTANPPIMKIANYSKMLYEIKKAAKKNKQSKTLTKEIQLSVSIAKHDMETKANHARTFILDGNKVKVVLKMKGRELSRREENKKCIFEFITMLEEVAVPESMPKDEGNRTIVILKKKK